MMRLDNQIHWTKSNTVGYLQTNLKQAVEVSSTHVPEHVARFGIKPRLKGKASRIRKFQS